MSREKRDFCEGVYHLKDKDWAKWGSQQQTLKFYLSYSDLYRVERS